MGAVLLCAVFSDAFGQSQKFDPRLKLIRQDAVKNARRFSITATETPNDPLVDILLRIRAGVPRSVLAARYPRARFGPFTGDIITAKVRISSLGAMEADADIQFAQAAIRLEPALEVIKTTDKNGADFLGALDPVFNTFGNNKGQGVIIGIIDTGIDFTHLDFIDDSDTNVSRILSIWDQTITSHTGGPFPSGTLQYGAKYTQSQINDHISGADTSVILSRDTDGHGTHVAGIAAGDGSDSDGSPAAGTFIGIAPLADIIAVKTNFFDSGVLDGISYIVAEAAAAGKRAVINMSLSGQAGAHDGTSAIESGVAAVAASTPIVISMGNDQILDAHASFSFSAGGNHTFTVNQFSASSIIDMEFWSPAGDTYTVSIDDGATPVSAASGQSNSGSLNSGSVLIDNDTRITDHPNGDKQIFIRFSNTSSPRTFNIKLTNTAKAGSGRVDAWIFDKDVAKFTSDVDTTGTIGSPAAAVGAIAVGSYCAKRTWTDKNNTPRSDTTSCTSGVLGDISPFSSRGPTRTTGGLNRTKPDLTAPGQLITSALSVFQSPAQGASTTAQDSKHKLLQGTSMASPVVAGYAALKIQNTPGITAAQIISQIQTEAREDTKATATPNNTWGHGKLNIIACGDVITSTPTVAVPTTLGISSISWSWDAVTDATSYNIYYATNTGVLIANSISPSFTFTGLTPNATYGLKIYANNACGDGPGETSTSTSTLSQPWSQLSLTEVAISSAQINIQATNADMDQFHIGTSTSTDFSGTLLSTGGILGSGHVSETYWIEGLTPLTTYYFRAATLNSLGGANTSTYGTVRTSITHTSLIAPGPITFSDQSSTSVKSNWTLNSNPAGLQYIAQISTASDFSGTITSSSTFNLFADHRNLSINTTYYFRVQAATGPLGAIASTPTHAQTPGVASASYTDVFQSSVVVHWTNAGNPAGTRMVVESSTMSNFTPLVDSSNTLNTSLLITGLNTNTTVYSRIAGIGHSGTLSPYRILSTSTLTNPPGLASESFVTVTSSITVRWTALPASPSSSTSLGYQIEASTSPDFSPITSHNRTNDPAASSLGLTGLLFQTTYYLRVGALNWNSAPNYTLLGSSLTITPVISSAPVTNTASLVLSIAPTSLQLDRVEVTVPPDAFAAGVTITVNDSVPFTFNAVDVNQARMEPLGAGVAVDIDAGGSQPKKPVLIRMDYNPLFLPAGAHEEQLVIARFHDGVWNVLETQIDTKSNVLLARTNHFSLFAPFFVPAGTGLSGVNVFPIPWEPGSGDLEFDAQTLSFTNMPAHSTVRIHSTMGEILWDKTANASGMVFWDGKNNRGAKVASGTYLALISGGGSRRVVRVVIIR